MALERRALGRTLAALATLALLLGAAQARAQALGFTGYAEAGYANTDTTTTDATGRSIHYTASLIPQRYRLTYDRQFFPYLTLNAVGMYQWIPGSSTTDGVRSDSQSNLWSLDARLTFGPPVLNLTPFFTRVEQSSSIRTGDLSIAAPTLVSQTYGAYGGWSPLGLPTLGVKLSRTENFDSLRAFRDGATNEAFVSLAYLDIEQLALRYTLRYANTTDKLQALDASDLNQSGQVTWSDAFLDRRLTTYVNYQLALRSTSVSASGPGGIVYTQLFPVAGLSLVEAFPAVPTQDTLAPNPALIDGNTTASAGIDIGFQPSLGGDQNFRDMGVQLADALTPANTFYVWVDRPLPAAVWSAYSWTAYVSNDNLSWTPLPIVGAPIFSPFQNRFEITTSRVQARYFKVVTRPLPASVTVDPQYADVFVTEVQLLNAVSAGEAPPRTTQMSGSLNATARFAILRTPSLVYDFAAFATHDEPLYTPKTWSVLNGLSFSHSLGPSLRFGARIDRTDSDQAAGHESLNRWSVQAAINPLPTLGAAITYSGQLQQFAQGTILTNGVTLLARADLYEGLSLQGNVGYSLARDATGRQNGGPTANVSLTVTPMRSLVFTGSWVLSNVIAIGGVLPTFSDQTQLLQGQVTFTPVPAFFVTAGAQRLIGFGRASITLSNLTLGASPFPQGQLQLRFAYNETLDTGSSLTTRLFGPSLRWTIRPSTFLDLSYTWNDSIQPALTSYSRVLLATFTITLR